MASLQSLTMLICACSTFLASGEAFFLYSSKKTNTDRSAMPLAAQYYRDTSPALGGPLSWSQAQQYAAYDSTGPVTVALPVAVPIHTQMTSLPSTLKGTVHNVQLVPCLCPVSKDMEALNMQQQSQQQGSASSYIVQTGPVQSTST